jgi:plastocyanin
MDRAKAAAAALAGAAGWIVAKVPGVAGAALVSTAGWMVYEPAGVAIAGGFCLLMDWRQR